MKYHLVPFQPNLADEAVVKKQLELTEWLEDGEMMKDFVGEVKEHIIGIMKTDLGVEADITSVLTNGEEKRALPGFNIAPSVAAVNAESELARAAEYIGIKYIPKLDKPAILPVHYQIISAVPDAQKSQITLNFKKETLPFETEQEYWDHHIQKKLTGHYSHGRAVHVLAEAFEHFYEKGRVTPHTHVTKWGRDRINFSLSRLLDMVKKAGLRKDPVWYSLDSGNFELPDLEFRVFYNPETRKRVFTGENPITLPVELLKKLD